LRFARFCEGAANTARAGSAAIDLCAEGYALTDRASEAREIIADDREARALQFLLDEGEVTEAEIEEWLASEAARRGNEKWQK
jgi:hypothetical protein